MSNCKTDCVNNQDPITLDEIDKETPNIFILKEDGKCYCFFINGFYRYIFGGTDPNIDVLPKKPKNPYTKKLISFAHVKRLQKEYIHYLSLKKDDEKLPFKQEDIDGVRDEINNVIAYRREYAKGSKKLSFKEAANIYFEEVEEIEEDDEVEKVRKIINYLLSKR